jgi:sulfotransferase
MNGALEQMGAGGEFASFFDQDKRKDIFRVLFDVYYQQEQGAAY